MSKSKNYPLVLATYPPANNGFSAPVITPTEADPKRQFKIASIEQIAGFLGKMSAFGHSLSMEKIQKLVKARKTITQVPEPLKETAKGHYTLTLFQLLGNNI